jgi:hypothetical protein
MISEMKRSDLTKLIPLCILQRTTRTFKDKPIEFSVFIYDKYRKLCLILIAGPHNVICCFKDRK